MAEFKYKARRYRNHHNATVSHHIHLVSPTFPTDWEGISSSPHRHKNTKNQFKVELSARRWLNRPERKPDSLGSIPEMSQLLSPVF